MSRWEGKNIVVVRIRRGKRVVSLVRGGKIQLLHWQREKDRPQEGRIELYHRGGRK
jgi:hypothetical protein